MQHRWGLLVAVGGCWKLMWVRHEGLKGATVLLVRPRTNKEHQNTEYASMSLTMALTLTLKKKGLHNHAKGCFLHS